MTQKYNPEHYFYVYCLKDNARVQAEYFKENLITKMDEPVCLEHLAEIEKLTDILIERKKSNGNLYNLWQGNNRFGR